LQDEKLNGLKANLKKKNLSNWKGGKKIKNSMRME